MKISKHANWLTKLLIINIYYWFLEKEKIGEKYETLKQLGANFICGEKYLDNLTEYDIIIRSPGMYFNDERLQKAIKSGTVVTSEMELFDNIGLAKS